MKIPVRFVVSEVLKLTRGTIKASYPMGPSGGIDFSTIKIFLPNKRTSNTLARNITNKYEIK